MNMKCPHRKGAISASAVVPDEQTMTMEIESEGLVAKRKRAELTIEVWRSLNANQRRGNV